MMKANQSSTSDAGAHRSHAQNNPTNLKSRPAYILQQMDDALFATILPPSSAELAAVTAGTSRMTHEVSRTISHPCPPSVGWCKSLVTDIGRLTKTCTPLPEDGRGLLDVPETFSLNKAGGEHQDGGASYANLCLPPLQATHIICDGRHPTMSMTDGRQATLEMLRDDSYSNLYKVGGEHQDVYPISPDCCLSTDTNLCIVPIHPIAIPGARTTEGTLQPPTL